MTKKQREQAALELAEADSIAARLRQIEGNRVHDKELVALLDDASALGRLEILSGALDDIIALPDERLRDMAQHGSPLERMYSITLLCRNAPAIGRLFLNDRSFDDYDHGPIWKAACDYALAPSLSAMNRLLSPVWEEDVTTLLLAINLAATLANAVHRVLLHDILKVAVASGVFPERVAFEMKRTCRSLGVRQSWRAISDHEFSAGQLASFLS
jgi:hypothetical protein